ncbi:MAG: ACP S-malonyltransferase [Candidatus Eisenbacteria bacterium]|nr:ACP S-malonyltransferase [Candidatus Eisenbacteria bacterium]
MQRTAFLFPGQGSQRVGMGRDLFEGSQDVRDLYERASEAVGLDIAAVSFEGPEDKLTRTDNAQPALLVAGVAAMTELVRRGVEPWAVAGHSLGEYSALVAAGSIDFEDGVRAVRERGRLMYEAGLKRPGTMAAIIGLDEDAVGAIVKRASAAGVVQTANLNAPGQVVISGEVDAVKEAMDLAGSGGARRVIGLKVSGAFHSELVDEARAGMEAFLRDVEIREPRALFVSNVTGGAVADPEEIRKNLVAQIVSPVRWVDDVRALVRRSASLFLEVGPGNVLRGLLRRIEPEAASLPAGRLEDIERAAAEIASR